MKESNTKTISSLQSKLSILADAAKYDASCASSGSKRSRQKGELGDSSGVGICHSYTPDGRCISLLKILLTNYCIYDCLYCVNRISSDVPRARFTPDEVITLTMGFYRRNYIEGLFLSSGILKSPDYTAELLTEVARKLREEQRFAGYIHLKAAPKTDSRLIDEMSKWCDRVSINIELPTEDGLVQIAPAKNHQDVESSMSHLAGSLLQRKDEQKFLKRKASTNGSIKSRPVRFGARSQSTQMIVGATPASDLDILNRARSLYDSFGLSRVYYSGFSPIPDAAPMLPLSAPPLVREHRLYQADWLQRFYQFKVDEIVSDSHPFLDADVDPKVSWALRNLDFFPVDVNRASKAALLRVPGFGTTTVSRILKARRHQLLHFDDLKTLRVPLKRAKYFIELAGPNSHLGVLDSNDLRSRLVPRSTPQIGLFDAGAQQWKELWSPSTSSDGTNSKYETELTDIRSTEKSSAKTNSGSSQSVPHEKEAQLSLPLAEASLSALTGQL